MFEIIWNSHIYTCIKSSYHEITTLLWHRPDKTAESNCIAINTQQAKKIIHSWKDHNCLQAFIPRDFNELLWVNKDYISYSWHLPHPISYLFYSPHFIPLQSCVSHEIWWDICICHAGCCIVISFYTNITSHSLYPYRTKSSCKLQTVETNVRDVTYSHLSHLSVTLVWDKMILYSIIIHKVCFGAVDTQMKICNTMH